MDIFNLPVVYSTQTYNSHASYETMPTRARCSNIEQIGFARSLSLLHNCFSCNRPYYNYYKVGDIIPFQFHMKDVRSTVDDPTNPIVGWHQTGDLDIFYAFKAALYSNEDCETPIFDLVDKFTSDYWTGFSNLVGSIQTLFVDTGLFPSLKGFTLRVSSVRMVSSVLEEETVLWSEPFVVIPECIPNVLVYSHYANIDTLNNDHRTPEPPNIVAIKQPVQIPSGLTPYYNSRRYKATIMYIGDAPEKDKNENGRLLETRLANLWEFRGSRIAAYAAKEFSNIINGYSVKIDYIQNGILKTTEFDFTSGTNHGDGKYTNFVQNYTMEELTTIIKHTSC
jgi:hypothetical protein